MVSHQIKNSKNTFFFKGNVVKVDLIVKLRQNSAKILIQKAIFKNFEHQKKFFLLTSFFK